MSTLFFAIFAVPRLVPSTLYRWQSRSNLGTQSGTRLGSAQKRGLGSAERACDPIALGTGGRMRKDQILRDLLKSFQRGIYSKASSEVGSQLLNPVYLLTHTPPPTVQSHNPHLPAKTAILQMPKSWDTKTGGNVFPHTSDL